MSALIVARALALVWPDGRAAFPALDLTLQADQPVGLVGANGAGKSTLLRLLAGELKPTSGAVESYGRLGYLRQDIQPAPGETVAEALGVASVLTALARLAQGDTDDAVYEAIGDDWDAGERASEALSRLGLAGLPLDRSLASLSGGELVRVRLAALVRGSGGAAPRGPAGAAGAACLLLDEPSNHLDSAGRAALQEFLSTWRGGLLLATHDRTLLADVDAIVELSPHGLAHYGGNYDDYVEQRRIAELAAAGDVQAASQRLASVRHKAAAAMDRQRKRIAQGGRHWANQRERFVSDGKAQGTLVKLGETHAKRVAEATTALAEAKAKIRRKDALHVDLPATAVREAQVVLRLRGVTAATPERPLWREPLETVLVGPRRVGVVGANGTGKTTLLHLLAGLSTPGVATGGRIERGFDDVAFLDQRLGGLDLRRSPAELARERAPLATESERRGHLGRFLIGAGLAERPLGELSGGEALRAGLALALAGERPARLLLLDEPSNHLDLPSLTALEEALAGYAGALVVVSHDPAFLASVGIDTVWELSEAGLCCSPSDGAW